MEYVEATDWTSLMVPVTLTHEKFEIWVAVEFAGYTPGVSPRLVFYITFMDFHQYILIGLVFRVKAWASHLIKVDTGGEDRESGIVDVYITPHDLFPQTSA